MKNKYDTNITLEENSSLTYMLKNIKPGTTVLEFGPATGYMTKYLKEELGCKVYIVEIDEDACQKASAYAQEAICGSAEDLQWYKEFQNIRFDYITFADVLEHLVKPGKVLAWSAQLLKEDTGKILISLPNIGHNAVLVDLLNNKFKYRTTGIMDNTHLRFFTHDSAVELFHESGLHVEDEDAVVFDLNYAGLGNCEQDVSENIWSELRVREYGFVNQFLFTLTKNNSNNKSIVKKKVTAQYECALYYTVDEEYSEEQKILSKVEMKDEEFFTEFIIDSNVMVKNLIIVLLPFNGVINSMNMETNAIVCEINPVNGFAEKEKFYFLENEVRIQVKLQNVTELKYVRLSGKLKAVQLSEAVRICNGVISQTGLAIQHLNNEINRLNDENYRLYCEVNQLNNENRWLNEKINEDNVFIEKDKAIR